MPKTAKRPKREAPAADELPRRPPVPQPGRWRIMQTLAGKVRQFAFTCSRCKVTTYVACNRDMDAAADIVEHCECLGAREKPIEGTTFHKVIPYKARFVSENP